MTPLRDETIAARVSPALVADLDAMLEELRARGERRPDGAPLDRSTLIRRAVAAYVDRNLNGARRGTLELGALDGRPRAHRGGPATEQEAAEGAWPRANSDRGRALEFLRAAGADGMTGDELDVELNAGVYNGRRRLSELKAAGWAEVKRVRVVDNDVAIATTPARRKTRAGRMAEVYVLTPAARIRLAEEARTL